MTVAGVPLGMLASLAMAASFCCHLMPDGPAQGHHRSHGPKEPRKAPDQPGGCHAVLGCAAHRKLRTIT
jgi:hypothetical protein